MENFTVTYAGTSGKTVTVRHKKKDVVIATYTNVQYGHQLVVNGFDDKDRLESKTYMRVGWVDYEIHTSCTINILGMEVGPFIVTEYTDGEGFTCSLPDDNGSGNNSGCDVDVIEYSGHVTICYNGEIYCLSQSAAKNYLAMGAQLGSWAINISPVVNNNGGSASQFSFGEASIKFEVNTYPHPATAIANITFNVNREGPVTVAIFDTRDMQVGLTLFEETAQIGKPYTVIFNASSVKEGMYIIRLNTAGYVQRKKLLIKR